MAISDPVIASVTIPSGDTVSDSVYIGTGQVAAIAVPTIDSAKIQFQGSVDNSTFYEVVDETAGKVEVSSSTGQLHIEVSSYFIGGPYIKIQTSATQSSDRTFHLVIKAH